MGICVSSPSPLTEYALNFECKILLFGDSMSRKSLPWVLRWTSLILLKGCLLSCSPLLTILCVRSSA